MGYDYHLAKWNERDKSLRCPGCGKRMCFKEYLDANGVPVDKDNHTVGKCDHQWCAYHLTPSEFLSKNPSARRVATVKVEQRQMKRIEVDMEYLVNSMRKYEENTLVRWIKSLPWSDEVRQSIDTMLKMYLIGTAKGGGTIFWQMDEQGIIRTGKKITYKEDGHRMKDADGSSIGTNWVHAMLKKRGMFPDDEYQLVQCLFGLHLIKGADKDITVCIVESEKTALLMALLDDGFGKKRLWMACGGLYLLNPATLVPLKGHHVMLYPDANGVDSWSEIVHKNKLKDVEICTNWMRFMTDEDPPGADIADVCIRRMYITPEARLQEMEARNPAVRTLVDKLHLQIKKT